MLLIFILTDNLIVMHKYSRLMKGIKMNKLSESQEDVLKEIGTMGSGRASTALSELIDAEVRLKVPLVSLVSTKEVPELVGGPKQLVVGTYAPLEGDLLGTIVVIFPIKSALILSDFLSKKPPGTSEVLDAKNRNDIRKVGGILSQAYLETIREFLGLNAKSADLRVVSAFGESLPDFVLLNIDEGSALLLKTNFDVSSAKKFQGDFVLLLTQESVGKILETIDKKFG